MFRGACRSVRERSGSCSLVFLVDCLLLLWQDSSTSACSILRSTLQCWLASIRHTRQEADSGRNAHKFQCTCTVLYLCKWQHLFYSILFLTSKLTICQRRPHAGLHIHLPQRGSEDAGAFQKSKGVPHQPSSWEAISGSSRMKGGSSTKILLELVLSAAHAATFTNMPVTYKGILQHMEAYKQTLDITYAQTAEIAALLEAAGQSLRCGRRVCYLGWGSVAILGLIDASECNPTFGADFEDVRGFISGGYREMNNNEGPLSSLGSDFRVAHKDFLHLVLPSLNDQDTVLLLYTHSDNIREVAKLAHRAREKTSNIHAVYHQVDGAAAEQQDDIDRLCSSSLKITWASSPASGSLLHMWELSTKLLLNAVSTGAHILKGKIYQNDMIDVQVTNSKLYRRATRLLQKLSGYPESKCEEALLKSLYQVDTLTIDITSSDITAHTRTARNRTKVVPLALVCLLTGCTVMEAESHLEQQPIVREAVETCLSKLV
ncbi:glucokinase regulatory protein isoform X6 [Labrus bergylta]|uniref:glucokinase regulatory protein isoform X6 n=1 Tax=Labrus bergylta TaxID=56723 RepID=UPI0033143D77